MGFRPALVLPVLLAFLALPFGAPPAAADLNKIQPGDVMSTTVGSCTMDFAFDGPGGKVYMGTAAHCVTEIGQDVRTSQYGIFGKVAWIGDSGSTARDFAFIEVLPAFVDKVDPSVRGYPQYPTGYTVPADTATGDQIQISGHGTVYSANWNTQTKRVALHTSDSATTHAVAGPIHWGDSGGPLVHIKTGKAYGIVSRLCFGTCTETGPTVQGMISYATANGFPVTLKTV